MFMLAPMEDITGPAFRYTCHKYGADLTFTELTRIESLAKKNKSTMQRIEIKDTTPLIIQLLGVKEEYFKRFLNYFEPKKGFMGFNLNIGCPSPQVINIGQGAAMIRRIAKTKKIISIFRDYSYPISIKMRLGINKQDKKNKVYLHLIDAIDADFFVVHARYALQTYDEPADYRIYNECVKTGKRIVANGDIKGISQVNYLREKGINDFMLGREAVNNPQVFNLIKGIPPIPAKRIYEEYLSLSDAYKEPFRYRKNLLKHLKV